MTNLVNAEGLREEMENATEEEREVQIKELFPKLKVTITNIGTERSGIGTNYKYRVTITNEGKRMGITFHDSVANFNGSKKPNMVEVLYCVVSDAQSYENTDNAEDFAREFGYEDIAFATKVFNACEKEHDNLIKLFNETGYELLGACFEGY